MAPGTAVLPKLLTTLSMGTAAESCAVSFDVSPSEIEVGFYEKWRRRLGYGGRSGHDAATQTDYDPIVVEARAIVLDLFHLVRQQEEEGGQRSDPHGWPVRSKASRTMWRVASELLVKHSIVYNSIVDKLTLDANSPDYSAFRIMCDEVFDGGNVTWGRIIVLYALFIQVARKCHQNKRDHSAWAIADFVGLYVGETIADWIAKEGGWGALEEAFPSNDVMEQKVWKGLLVTGIGLGMLATAIKAIR